MISYFFWRRIYCTLTRETRWQKKTPKITTNHSPSLTGDAAKHTESNAYKYRLCKDVHCGVVVLPLQLLIAEWPTCINPQRRRNVNEPPLCGRFLRHTCASSVHLFTHQCLQSATVSCAGAGMPIANGIARLSVRPFVSTVSFEPLNLWTGVFYVRMDHYHSSPGIECQGYRSRSKVNVQRVWAW